MEQKQYELAPPIILTESYSQLGINVQEIDVGRRRFEMNFPNLGKISVQDIEGSQITAKERELIILARKSYEELWGGNSLVTRTAEDPFDGWSENSIYETTHQIAEVLFLGGETRVLTNRKVSMKQGFFPKQDQLWDDVAFWNVRDNRTGEVVSFAEALQKKYALSEVAAISRTGTHPYNVPRKTEGYNEGGAAAWSLMQIAALHDDNHKIWVCMLGPIFRDQILTIGQGDQKVKLGFTPTAETLGFEKNRQLVLNLQNPDVPAHMLKFPGYWLESESLIGLFNNLIEKEQLSLSDFHDAFQEMGTDATLANLHALTNARHAKHLIKTFEANKILGQMVIENVKGKPFSSTIVPDNWRASNFRMLRTAREKYQ